MTPEILLEMVSKEFFNRIAEERPLTTLCQREDAAVAASSPNNPIALVQDVVKDHLLPHAKVTDRPDLSKKVGFRLPR